MKVLTFLIKNLTCIHAGTGLQKSISVVKLAAVPAVGLSLIERFAGWYFDNQVFMSLVLVTIIMDMILGAVVHWNIKHDFSFRKLFWGFAGKTMVLVFGYVMFEMIHQIVQDVEIVASYFKITLQLVVILYPAGSAMGNMSVITGGKFPPIGWMKRFERFSNEGDIEILKTKKNEDKNSDADNSCDAAAELPDTQEGAGN